MTQPNQEQVKVTDADPTQEDREAIKERVAELLKLEAGWDSYGGEAINPAAAERALSFALALHNAGCPLVQVVPCSDGSLSVSTFGEDESMFDFTGEPNKTADIIQAAFDRLATTQKLEAEREEEVLSIIKDTLHGVRAENAGNFKREGAEWEAYDQAVGNCYNAVVNALTKPNEASEGINAGSGE